MNLKLLLASTLLMSIGLAASAQAATLVARPTMTDTEFSRLTTSGQFTQKFVARGQIGNRIFFSPHEIDLLDAGKDFEPTGVIQHEWQNSTPVAFRLDYKNSEVVYTIAGKTLSSKRFKGNATDIFFRTQSVANSRMQLSDLNVTDGQGNLLVGDLASSGADDIDYLQLSQIRGDFSLMGKVTLSWTGQPPLLSPLSYQLHVGTTPQKQVQVPEPAATSALIVAGLRLLAMGRRR
jgi:hypothetical protein